MASPARQTAAMARRAQNRLKQRPRYFFREWRKFRQLTQQQLAGRIDMSTSSISQLENGKQGFTDETLALWAEALRCSPGALLTVNPLDKRSPWSLWESLPPSKRAHVLAVMEAMASNGPDDDSENSRAA